MHWLCHNRVEYHPSVIIEYSSKQKKANQRAFPYFSLFELTAAAGLFLTG
jgi:hypothetical protein